MRLTLLKHQPVKGQTTTPGISSPGIERKMHERG